LSLACFLKSKGPATETFAGYSGKWSFGKERRRVEGNIGTLSVQELFFQLIGLLGVRLGVGPVGMVELFVHGASLLLHSPLLRLRGIF